MEFVVAVAIGLNPYVGLLLVAALAARTTHVPLGPLFAPPSMALHAVVAIVGVAVAIDLVLGKLPRFAPRCRRVSQAVAPAAAALAAAALTRAESPLLAIAGAGALAHVVATLVSSAAARGRRSPAWCGWGHVPVLMAAATGSAAIVPLTIARLPIGIAFVVLAVAVLLLGWVLDLRAAFAVAYPPLTARTGRGPATRPAWA